MAPPSVFLGDVFVRDGLDDVGAGDEHVAGVVDHEDEIGDGGRVDRAARARAHDGGDLRDHAAGERVAQEDVRVTGQRDDAFLNARAAGIVQADHGRAGLQRQVHDLADFLRVGFGERAAEDGEILREDVDEAAVDAAVAGDEAVAGMICSSMPKSRQRCVTSLSSSSNEPSSSSSSMRSRALSLPSLCWRARRSGPPPCSAAAWRRRSSSRRFIGFYCTGIRGGGGLFVWRGVSCRARPNRGQGRKTTPSCPAIRHEQLSQLVRLRCDSRVS